jgi:two-component system heavy metal sensor histidine kinase CusS
MMKRWSVRWQLTLWYGGVLALVLVFFCVIVLFVMRHQLLQRIDQGLTEELADVLYEVKRAGDSAGLQGWLERRFARHEGFDFQITDGTGDRFFVSERLLQHGLPLPEPIPTDEGPVFQSLTIGSGGRWRIVSIRAQGPEKPLTVQVARSLATFDHESRELLATFLLAGPLTLLAAVWGGYFLARRALGPVEKMSRAADEITADRLSGRIEIDNPDDELGALARTLNRMIERLEGSFTQMQRFTADAAHELRTPLAIIRNEAEVALRAPRTGEEYGRVLENLLEETNRLSNLADQLLFLSRHDAGLHQGKPEALALDGLLKEVVGNMQLVAETRGLELVLTESCPCKVVADPSQLRRVFYNLMDNAVKYTRPKGRIAVALTALDSCCAIAITDTGIGIPPGHLHRIFDRFYRVDASRTDEAGAGLGLAICRSIVKALAGDIAVESVVGRGTTMRVTLPRTS